MPQLPRGFEEFVQLVREHSPREGLNLSSIGTFGTYRTSQTHGQVPAVDIPALWTVVQGQKVCHVGSRTYRYDLGTAIAVFSPMAVVNEVVEASPDSPMLIVGVAIDLGRLAEVLLRLDRADGGAVKPASVDPSGIVAFPLTDSLLDPLIRLFRASSEPTDAAMLSETLIDEIYYRMLASERGGELRTLLQQRGSIQLVAKAVAHIHEHLDQPVSVDNLARMVHLSRPAFYDNFKAVMHTSPLQYAKSVKLDRAQTLIRQGKRASEAGYLVGYNSPSQFSREYKRHFGYAPSATS